MGIVLTAGELRDEISRELCAELGVTRQTLYRHVSPTGELREDGRKVLSPAAPSVLK